MNNNKDLIKEAIADAKAVREVALANAKLALQEAFEPKLKTIMSAHLEEELSDDDNEEGLDEMMDDEMEQEGKEDGMEDEIDINALLAELESGTDTEDKEIYNEEESEEETEETIEEAKDEEETEEKETEEETEEMSDDEDIDVGDMTKDDIIDLIRQEISAQLDSEDPVTDQTDTMMDDELDAETGMDDMETDELMEDVETFANTHNISAVDLYNTIKNLTEASKKKKHSKEEMDKKDVKKDTKKKDKDLEEAINTINILKNELNEVNLLNAKLLYANKLFNKFSLTESQKLKVINSFDNAETVRETKLVFNTLNESFESETKAVKQKTKTITENLGMASKPSGISKPAKQTLNESNDFVTRLQKLANIKL
jgi:hypothetical protein